jgi:hypothetical protein
MKSFELSDSGFREIYKLLIILNILLNPYQKFQLFFIYNHKFISFLNMLAEKYSIFTPNNKKTFFENNIHREIVEATKKITKK